MTGTLSYRPEETGGRQREKSLDTGDWTTDIAFYRGQKTARWWSVFTTPYESRFSLSSDSHRILIWRERGSRNHPSNIIERDRYGGRGVLVWGGIMLGSRTDLHIFDAGSVNGTRCCNEILLPYVRLFRGAMGLQFLFMDDNAAAEQLLESEDIEPRTLPPVTIRELRLALQDEWAAMPQQLIDTLILSMGRRCETCLATGEKPVRAKGSKNSSSYSHLSFRSPHWSTGRITNIDLADMHLIYGLAEENARAEGRLYRERYHHRDAPDRQFFTNLHHNLCEYKSLRNNGHGEGGLRETGK
ncbi:transposable element Tc1 transposase [Trichonephila clavipes]|nr:transposable element Tc1 transposase [Trichonephila clavipes]